MNTYAIYFSKLSVRPLKLRTSAYAIYFSKLSVPPISNNYFSNYSEINEYHVAQSIFQDYPPRIILTALPASWKKKIRGSSEGNMSRRLHELTGSGTVLH